MATPARPVTISPMLLSAGGTTASAIGSFTFLAVASRRAGIGAFPTISTFWSLLFFGAVGLLIPLEQEAARRIALAPPAERHVISRDAMTDVIVGGVMVAVPLGLASYGIAGPTLGRSFLLPAMLTASLCVLSVFHAARAWCIGNGRLAPLCRLLVAEGAARLTLLLALGSRPNRVLVCACIPTAAIIAVGSLGRSLPKPSRPRRPAGYKDRAALVGAAIAAQGVFNTASLAAPRFARPSEVAALGAFLSAVLLGRGPLMAFGALEAPMVSRLAPSLMAGDLAHFRRQMRAYLGGVVALGCAMTLLGTPMTSIAVVRVFGASSPPAWPTIACVFAASSAALVALVAGQGSLLLGGHRLLPWPWLLGLAAGATTLLAPLGLDSSARATAGFIAGGWVAAATSLVVLRHCARDRLSATASPDVDAAPDLPVLRQPGRAAALRSSNDR